MRDALEDAEEAIETLGPILGVDDEDLDKYQETFDGLLEEESDLAQRLEA
jgi:hypothetical protein